MVGSWLTTDRGPVVLVGYILDAAANRDELVRKGKSIAAKIRKSAAASPYQLSSIP